MKSPVARNMHPGNKKLRGKTSRLLPCGCCMMIDFRWSEKIKEAKKEIQSVG